MAKYKSLTLEDLQGEWKVVGTGRDGGKAPFFIPWLVSFTWEIEGNKFKKYNNDEIFSQGTLTISPHPTEPYAEIDEQAEDEDHPQLGLIRFVGKKIEHIQSDQGEARPSFPYDKNSSANWGKMKRVPKPKEITINIG